ncbi:sulfurtransferase TusA family protein [Pseudanabaena sp. FACHB-2040]|uniref:sulfurtransferase TusA family protein n=1 Tax=Pseudanabaena sp. FACHB-2040 TaxID=2692859 RepID=UPI0016823335|nr:sulfurtransferase TusA family protein [Pseudanabaena sp. FACHB-2040]MBD2260475.1 sulfurtransferase TusA family protein [Pseudanabaena sp. FACHB-2040]
MSEPNQTAVGAQAENLENPLERLDLRGTPCPINFVRTKLKLEQMPAGSMLEVWLDGGEPMEQVPDSLTMEGYRIEQVQDCSDYFALHVRKPE